MSNADVQSDLRLLETTSDANERNAAALRLADKEVPEARTALLRLIGRDDLRSERGTLVYCLRPFDCSDSVGLLIDLVISGGFEEAHEALAVLDLVGEVQGDEIDEAFVAVELAMKNSALDDWRRALLGELLEMFD